MKTEDLKSAKNKDDVKALKTQIDSANNVPDIRAALKKLAAIVLGE